MVQGNDKWLQGKGILILYKSRNISSPGERLLNFQDIPVNAQHPSPRTVLPQTLHLLL
jgi:hypothetical protein